VLKPIDGAENFINGYPHFSLSLCSMIDNVVTSSVVIDPIRREEFSAYGGGGANLNNNKIRSSKQNNLEDSMLSYKKSFKDDEYKFDKTYKELANQNLNMRESGCLSLDLAYVGTGRLDGAWAYDVELIDIAAGSLIAQEGGALVSNFNGDPKFIDGNNIISATSKIYKSVLKSIKPYLEV
jgi:myo-inositol-1(or 4)-monophosphatase